MTKYKLARFAVLLCCIQLFLGAFAGAQAGNHYSTTGATTSVSENTFNCVVGRGTCWKQVSSGFGILKDVSRLIAVTPVGDVFAVGLDEKLYQYANHAWQVNSSAPTGVAGVTAASSTDIYVITFPNGLLYHYDGTSWKSLGINALALSEGSDGTLYLVTGSPLQPEKLSNGTLTPVPNPSGHGIPQVIAVGAKDNVWLIMQDHTLWSLNSSGAFVEVAPPSGTTAPAIVVASGNATDGSGLAETWLITANDGTVTNNVFQYNYSTGGWIAMTGLLDNIGTGGHMFTVGTRSDLETTYHFNPLMVSVSATTSGYYDCSGFPNFSCPQGSLHTASTTITFGSGGNVGHLAASGAPADNLTATAGTFTMDCDPVMGNPNDPDCQVEVSGQVVCAVMGAIFAASTIPVSVTPPVITGPHTVWWFNGQKPGGYATSITLTSSGGSNTTWSVPKGANMVNLSTNAGSQTTVTSTGSVFSSTGTDIAITATANGVTSAYFYVTSRRPYRLVKGLIDDQCDATYGYLDHLNYTIEDQMQTRLPSSITLNENWTTAVVKDFLGTNWRRQMPPGSYTTLPISPAAFSDLIGGENIALPPQPPTACPGAGQAVEHWGQEWRMGSLSIGVGSRVQTDTIQKYTNHAEHQNITSPAP